METILSCKDAFELHIKGNGAELDIVYLVSNPACTRTLRYRFDLFIMHVYHVLPHT